MRSQRFVLDTSAFTGLGEKKKEIEIHIGKLTDLIAKARKKDVSCYVTPSVWEEMKKILGDKKIKKAVVEKLDAWTIEKAPSRCELNIPAEFLYEYVGAVRERFNRGLREAEKAVLATHHMPETHAKIITELRDKYRTAVRKGILDSQEDLDVLLLAKELGAGVVSSDEGLLNWAKRWGIRYETGPTFRMLLAEQIKR